MNPNVYEKQKLRYISRKVELINMMGGKCSLCGYDNNYAALDFHHVNPSEKSFPLDARHLSNCSVTSILEESKKCILVCANCHRELHNTDFQKEVVNNMETTFKSVTAPSHKQSICPVCGTSFNYCKGKIYCSPECREKDKGYPSRDEVRQKYQELKSKQKVADFYGLTRKIIIRLLKD